MKIIDALITEIKEDVTTRNICGGIALMHGKLTVTVMAIVDDGRCVKLRFPTDVDQTLKEWSETLKDSDIHPSFIIKDLSIQALQTETQQKQVELEI